MAIITLLTDFGTQDEYVGAMKGVILGINPQATLVDISHDISPQAVASAGHMLRSAYTFFPAETIHLAVVDPGVGSDRAIIAAHFDGHLFMAPDNGLLPLVWRDQSPQALVRVQNKSLFLDSVSRTFHGRDIFAPVVAHLSAGTQLAELGPGIPMDEICVLSDSHCGRTTDGAVVGEVIHVDRFGNLMTNIEAGQVRALVQETRSCQLIVKMNGYRMEGLVKNYAAGGPQSPVAIIGSRDCLEIAVNGGHAGKLLKVGLGTTVSVECLNP